MPSGAKQVRECLCGGSGRERRSVRALASGTGPSSATSANPTPASAASAASSRFSSGEAVFSVRVDAARPQPGQRSFGGVERGLGAVDAEHDVATDGSRRCVGGPETDRTSRRGIGVEAPNVDPCSRQVRREPPTGLTEPEDRNPSRLEGCSRC